MVRLVALVGLLVYLGLDPSLPGMPGAFVFEPDESVESAQMTRWRPAGEIVLLPTPDSNTLASRSSVEDRHTWRPVGAVRRPGTVAVAGHLPRATLVAPRPSEDPL